MSYFARLQPKLSTCAFLLAIVAALTYSIIILLQPLEVFAQAGAVPAAPSDRPNWINSIILNLLWVIVVNVFGFWVTAGGFILNYGLGLYVVGFGDQYLGTNIGVAVDNLWVVIRDLFNLTFIFGLVYLGIRMILNSDDSNTKRNLIYLIMAALLVNFSLFITKFVIDFTNVTATQFLNNIETPGAPPFVVPNLSPGGSTYNVPDVAAAVSTRMNLASLLSGGGPNFDQIATSAGYAYVIFTAIFLLIAGFVFLSGGLLLMIRFVVLNFYMIFSPIMFLGWVFPNLQSITSRYWKGFLGRAFFAPVYVILVYIALTIMGGYTNGISTFRGGAAGVGQMFGSSPTVANVQAGFLGIAIPFIIVSGFMLGALVIAQKLGADGANMAVSVGTNLRKRGQRFVGSATAGVAARAGRTAVGGTAQRLANSKALNKYAGKSYLGKQAMLATRSVADSSFDVRQVGGVGAAMGIGTGKKGGFTSRQKEDVEFNKKFADSLSKADVDKDPEAIAEVNKKIKEAQQKAQNEKALLENRNTQLDEAVGKSVEDIDEWIQSTSERINAINNELTNPRSKLTENQKKERMSELQQQQALLGDLGRIKSSKENDAEIEQLKSSLQTQSNGPVAEEIKRKITELENRRKNTVSTLQNEITSQMNQKQSIISGDEKALKPILDKARAQVKYANQLAYIDQLENQKKRWDKLTKPQAIAGSVVGLTYAGTGAAIGSAVPVFGVQAGLVGAAAGVAATVGGGAALGAGLAQGSSYALAGQVSKLREIYGEDGTSAIQREREDKAMKALVQAQKDSVEVPKDDGDKKDE